MKKLDQAIAEVANEDVPDSAVQAAAGRVRGQLFGQTENRTDRIRSCADFQALIPDYLDRSLSAARVLLLQDHTRECVACRQAVATARSGAAPTLVRPLTPSSQSISKAWAIAAMATVVCGLGAWAIRESFFTASNGRISVQSVSGTFFAVSDGGSVPIFAGSEIAGGQRVRTAKNSRAMVRLGDGSLVEMAERAELSVSPDAHGANIRLDHGNIIVQAAKQRTGTLNVLTPDCTVSVKGTIFAVARGTKGSRVSVVEGSVKVDQGAHSDMLKPGEQVSTDASLGKTAVRDEVAWSRDSARYVALLGELSTIQKGLEAMPSPGLRYESKLLSLIPERTVLYAAMPNVGGMMGEAQKLFNERLQQSEVLRTWWEEQKDGPKLQEMLQKLRTFSDYLGDEIVVTVTAEDRGNYGPPIVLAEVKRPGLAAYLNAELKALQGGSGMPEVVELRAPADDAKPAFYGRERRNGEAAKVEAHMTIGIKDGLLAVAWSKEDLDGVAVRAADPDPSRAGKMSENLRKAYKEGASWLFCANMEHLTRNSVGNGRGTHGGPKLPRGLEAMRYLLVERKEVAGKTENQAALTFDGRRSGVAAWLAEPSAMGSLDFVSPKATFAVSMTLREPQWMLGDLLKSLSESDPEFQQKLNHFRDATGFPLDMTLGSPLGGEFTFALDGPLLPLPSWRLAVEVYNPEKLQWTIDRFIDAFNKDPKCPECKVSLAKDQVGARTFYTLTSNRVAYEIDYAYVDGYLVAAPSRTLLNQAIQTRATGLVLSRSEGFRSQLPRDGNLNFSALVYHNIGSAVAPLASQLSNMGGASAAQRESMKALAANSAPGLIYAYGEPDRIRIASMGTFFGLNLNSLALPALIGHGMSGKKMMQQ